jgi:alpha-1,3-glucosyltransferase
VFLFGYHVHEKAIMIPLCAFSIKALQSKKLVSLYFLFSFAASMSIFPILPLEGGKLN